jgi:hypothetical protein
MLPPGRQFQRVCERPMTYLAVITVVHTAVCVVAIVLGALVMRRLLAADPNPDPNQAFLAAAAIASLTGYAFPFKGVTPAQIVGLVALAILAGCWVARARLGDSSFWRALYAAGLTASLYLLAFVTVAQGFKHIAPLNALAPTGSEPPFAAVQAVVLVLFVILGFVAVRRFRNAPAAVPLSGSTVR